MRQHAANGWWICPKIADDFALKSADNDPDLSARRIAGSLPVAIYPRGESMKSLKLIGLVLGASFALSTAALAQDISVAVAGPMTGGESAFGRQMKNGAEQAVADINAAGGLLGKKVSLQVGDDACDPKPARFVAGKFARGQKPVVGWHYCSSSSISAVGVPADRHRLEVASITGPAAEWTLLTFAPDPRNKPTAKAIVERFKAKNIDPEGYTLYTYAALQVWSQAAAKAGTTDPKKVMDTIKAGAWDTVIGKMEFDAKGDIKLIDYVVYKWDSKGNYTEVNPKGS